MAGLAPSAAAAEVLGDSLGIRAENTAKFLYECGKGGWNLKAGQLVLVDESSLAGTLALDRITAHAAGVGAKVVLIGDWAQLADNREMVTHLNERARADLIAAGRVEAEGVGLHEGTTAGVGELVFTRRNDRRLSSGRTWIKNGDRWQITHRYDDGSLAVRR